MDLEQLESLLEDDRTARRGLLTALGTAATAGCTGLNGESRTETSPTETDTPTDRPTATDSPTASPTPTPLTYNEEEYRKLHQKWLDEIMQTTEIEFEGTNGYDLIKKMENDADIPPPEWYSQEYPDGGSIFHKDKMLEAEDIKTAVSWPADAARNHLAHSLGTGAISTHNNHFINLVELAVDQLHPDFQIEGGWINTVQYGDGDSHGVAFFHDNTNPGDWYHIDTTSDEIVQLNTDEIQDSQFYPGGNRANENGVYDPIMRFKPGPVNLPDMLYNEKSRSATSGIFSLASPIAAPAWLGNIWGQDFGLDAIYQHIWDGGDLETLMEPMKHTVFYQFKKPNEHLGFYGDSMENLTVAYGDQEVYKKVMEEPEPVSTEWLEENTEPVPEYR